MCSTDKGTSFYKYPRKIDFVEKFSLTTTGKIDLKLLRRREAELDAQLHEQMKSDQ
jgi:non-ribosomal peptide synthetase component E (peptide arylation enzyme)